MRMDLKVSARLEIDELRQRLQEAEETLNAIRNGEVDALVVSGPGGERVFTLEGAEYPYRVLVESMNEGALTLSLDGLVLYCNAAFARLVERPLDRMMGSDIREFVPDEERTALEDMLRIAQSGDVRAEMPVLGSSQSAFPTLISLSPITNGEEPSIAAIVTDLRERKRNEEAEAAVRARDDFLAIASHELRSPLSALVVTLEILVRMHDKACKRADAAEELHESQKLVRRARSQAERIAPLLDRLLDFSQMASGKFALQRALCDLNEIVAESAERFAQQASRVGSELRLDLENSVLGHWDRFRLEQVLTNLIGNAIKYGAGGPIDIRLSKANASALVLVEDRGIGIPPDALNRIFGRFERSSETENFSGLGLGLFITREIVEQHGGSIHAENREGGGARFVVELPLKKDSAAD